MKKFAFVLLALCLGAATAMNAQAKKTNTSQLETVDGPSMKLETTVVDYGTIEQDSDPYRYFDFENVGTEPLVIKHAKGSCGCTVPDYPKEPIMPGEKSQIKVRYATNRLNAFTKTITLTTNEGDNPSGMKRVLTIKGKVLPKAAEPETVPKSKPSIFSPGN